jgi:flagellar hook-associated protein 1 FlgK
MTYGFGLGAGLKALTAARLGIQTAGHNVANANTPGYSRQRVMQSAAMPATWGRFQFGTGVDVDGIDRLVDDGIERRLRLQLGLSGSAEVDASRWREIEGAFNEPDAGIGSDLSELFGRLGRLQTDPSDRALRGGVVQAGKSLAQGFNLLSTRFDELQGDTFDAVRGLVREVNIHTSAVAELNREIVAVEATGQRANDLRDAREQHVKELSALVDTRATERNNGTIDLLAGGHLVVSGTTTTALRVARNAEGTTSVLIGDSNQQLALQGGRIGALLAHESTHLPGMVERLDQLAHEMALQFNRVHSTGVPGSGPFQTLTSANGVEDTDGDGQRGDELLAQTGLPFEVQDGELWVTVTNRTTGDLERTRVPIDPATMSLRDVATALDSIDNLAASVDPLGRLRIDADSGYGFDFGSRLDPAPDSFGSFGGDSPSFGSTARGPFALTVPAAFTVNVNGTPRAVNLTSSDFRNPSAATAAELATAVNNQIGAFVTAKDVGGHLVIRSDSSGTASTMALTDGAGGPLATLGMRVGATATGQARAVEVAISGRYTGTNNQLTFKPDADGQIGVTPNLTVGVFDQSGARVATLNVGRGQYSPGDQIAVRDGIEVAFGPGTISASNGEVLALDTVADSDSSDVLVAIGMNSFFLGHDAETLQVNPDIEANADLLSAGLSGAAGDTANIDRLLALRETDLDGLGAADFETFYADLVGEVGFQAGTAETTLDSQDRLLAALQNERDSVSGVDLDEEMVDLVRYQQAFQAASRFITTVNDLSQTLINLVN